MELIKLNDKLRIPINQDNCSAAETRITPQTAGTSETFWPNGTLCCSKSHYIKILKMSSCLSSALVLFFLHPLYFQPFISIFVNDLGISSMLNGLVSVHWHVQSSRHFTWRMLMSILS